MALGGRWQTILLLTMESGAPRLFYGRPNARVGVNICFSFSRNYELLENRVWFFTGIGSKSPVTILLSHFIVI